MKAVVLAGGFGTRLRPLTFTRPKPLVPLVDRPVIDHVVDYLVSHGLNEIVVTTTYLRQLIIDHFNFRYRGDGHLSLSFPAEHSPLGTAGSVKNAGLEVEGEPFVVIQGDNITDMDLRGMIEHHYDSGALVTIALTPVSDPWNYGIAELDEHERVKRFMEKPSPDECFTNLASTGIYIIEPSVMEYVPDNTPFDFAKDLFPRIQALHEGEGRISGYRLAETNFWADVGQPEGYMRATEWLLKRSEQDVFIGANVEINGAGITGPAVIGDSTVVEEGCSVGPGAVLFEGVYIARNSSLEHCVIGEKTQMGENATVKQAIVGPQCVFGDDVEVYGGRIWPFISIPHRTTVDETLKRFVRFEFDCNGNKSSSGSGNILRNVPDEEAFYFNMRRGGRVVHTGLVAHSLETFLYLLKRVDKRSIYFHLREGHNDFATWIREVLGDAKLASELMEVEWWRPRDELTSMIEDRIRELKQELDSKPKLEPELESVSNPKSREEVMVCQ